MLTFKDLQKVAKPLVGSIFPGEGGVYDNFNGWKAQQNSASNSVKNPLLGIATVVMSISGIAKGVK